MRVLVACEFSGVVREAFRRRGHDAFSCDLIDSSDKSPYHIKADALAVSRWQDRWDFMIAHPPCTYLTRSGLRWITSPPAKRKAGVLYGVERETAMLEALAFVKKLWSAPIEKVVIENPRGVLATRWMKPSQAIQPWMFGEMEEKETCFWIRGLSRHLQPTRIVYDQMMKLPKKQRCRVHWESAGIKNGMTREQRRSLTLTGIADAMAEQWGGLGK
jgi:hypothetical protein